MLKLPKGFFEDNSSATDFKLGRELAHGNRVHSPKFFTDTRVFAAETFGEPGCRVSLKFNMLGGLDSWQCSCTPMPAYYRPPYEEANGPGLALCCHAVAVLAYAMQLDGAGSLEKAIEKERTRRIFAAFAEHCQDMGDNTASEDYGDDDGLDDGGFDDGIEGDGKDMAPDYIVPADGDTRGRAPLSLFLEWTFDRGSQWTPVREHGPCLPKPGYSNHPAHYAVFRLHLTGAPASARKPNARPRRPIKSLPDFLSAIRDRQPFSHGKTLAIDPWNHCFCGLDAQILEFLVGIFEYAYIPMSQLADDTTMQNAPHVTKGAVLQAASPILKGYLRLAGPTLRSLLSILSKGDGAVLLDHPGIMIDAPVRVYARRMNLGFALEADGSDLLLDIASIGGIAQLSNGCEAFYSGGAIYAPPRSQARLIEPMLRLLRDNGDGRFRFIEKERGKFASEALPLLERIGTVTLDARADALLDRRKLSAQVYLDRDGDDVVADVRFVYGDAAFNPFAPNETADARILPQDATLAGSEPVPQASGQPEPDTQEESNPDLERPVSPPPPASQGTRSIGSIIIRNHRAESRIMDILGDSRFTVKSNRIFLSGDDNQFDLVTKHLPRLQRYADIYYSDAFRKTSIRTKFDFNVRMSLQGVDLLQMDFNTGIATLEELYGILQGIREKKRFYKLRDGALLDISTNEARDVAALLDFIGADEAAIKNGVVTLPGFRAIYLDYFLRNSSITGVSRDRMMRDFIRAIAAPAEGYHEPPPSVGRLLRDYQKTGFKWLAALSERNMGGVLADDMGLGKTVQVLALLLHSRSEQPIGPGSSAGGPNCGASEPIAGNPDVISGPFGGHGSAGSPDDGSNGSIAGSPNGGSNGSIADSPDGTASRREARALIVVPTSLVYNWRAEIEKFTPELSCLAIAGSKAERSALIARITDFDVAITSYPLLRRDYKEYQGYTFSFLILDEAQNIKNPSSQNAMAAKCLYARRRFALTGTPMENRLLDLWSIFDFALPGFLRSSKEFAERYDAASDTAEDAAADDSGHADAASKEDAFYAMSATGSDAFRRGAGKSRAGGTAVASGAAGDDGRATAMALARTRADELAAQIRPFVLRRLKTDVLDELPEKIETAVYAEFEPEQRKIYAAHLEAARREIATHIASGGFGNSQFAILAALTRLRQLCCHPALFVDGYRHGSGKLSLMQEIVLDAIEGGHRILLFSQFTAMLSIIKQWADAEGIAYGYIDGHVPSAERFELVSDFNAGKGHMFIVSLKAGGAGLNLTGADTVIHYDPWWNPAVEDQATDRAYRIGQRKAVQVFKLLTAGSIEEKIFALQERKKRLIDAVVKPGETFLAKLSQDDVADILGLGSAWS